MAMATAMYHSGKNPLRKVTNDSEEVAIPRAGGVRRLHKAFIRYHDPKNWPMLREALQRMGRSDLIGDSKKHLIPARQPLSENHSKRMHQFARNKPSSTKPFKRAR